MIEELKQKLAAEAERLQYELNVTLPQEIRKAVEMGDLRENSEYKAALERQQFVQARLGHLHERLSKLSAIDPSVSGRASSSRTRRQADARRTISSSATRSTSRRGTSPWRRPSGARCSAKRSARSPTSSCRRWCASSASSSSGPFTTATATKRFDRRRFDDAVEPRQQVRVEDLPAVVVHHHERLSV
jgi:Transcription elongation factor, N-terminal